MQLHVGAAVISVEKRQNFVRFLLILSFGTYFAQKREIYNAYAKLSLIFIHDQSSLNCVSLAT